eukprot:scaffold120241_cov90-Phaeocystis_antarctica.AAC.3
MLCDARSTKFPLAKWKVEQQVCAAAILAASLPHESSSGSSNAFSLSVPYWRTSSRCSSFIGPDEGSVCWKRSSRPPVGSSSKWHASRAAPSAALGFLVAPHIVTTACMSSSSAGSPCWRGCSSASGGRGKQISPVSATTNWRTPPPSPAS